MHLKCEGIFSDNFIVNFLLNFANEQGRESEVEGWLPLWILVYSTAVDLLLHYGCPYYSVDSPLCFTLRFLSSFFQRVISGVESLSRLPPNFPTC